MEELIMRKKYTSLTNHYRVGDIEKALERNEKFRNCKYIVYEKLDGSNVSVEIHKHKTVFNSRNQSLGNNIDEIGFNGLGDAMKKHQPLFEYLRDTLDEDDVVILYGEYFGGNIQRRVDYGPEKRVLFFDMAVNGSYATQEEFLDTLSLGPTLLTCVAPIVGVFDSIEDAMAVDPAVRSEEANPKNEGKCMREGNVIKPFDVDPEYAQDKVFYIKYKNTDFEERTHHVDLDKLKKLKENAMKVELFKTYINKNRVLSFLSKGYDNTEKNYTTIIKGVLEDALKDYNEEKLDGYVELDYKDIKRLGSAIVKILREEV
jgi:Rnl2 family RNA ligase